MYSKCGEVSATYLFTVTQARRSIMVPWKTTRIFAAALIGACVVTVLCTPVLHPEDDLSSIPAHFLLHAFIPSLAEAKDMTCVECKAAAAVLDSLLAAGATVEELENFVINECITFDLFPADVCTGMVQLSSAEVLYVLNTTDYNSDTVCGFLLGPDHCGEADLDPWTIDIPGGKPEPFHPEPEDPTPGIMRILHLSDLHADLQYNEGSAAICEYPLCCRSSYGLPGPGEPAAGHWGTLSNCDIPLHTLEDLIAQAALLHPDLVYVTGDLPAHDVWAQSHDTNLLAINVTTNVLKKYFPDTPVVNVLGNHASAPVNSFVVPAGYSAGFSMDWLYEGVADMWAHWLPSDAVADLRRGGFYSYSPVPGLRVVSMNMNYCNTFNWWLLLENEDPVGELQWLLDTLAAAELSGEAVHLLGHIPSGVKDCDQTWSNLFNQIITRYESTVRSLFFGHTHGDSWQVFYDAADYIRPVATAFITPSATSGGERNPSFRMYVVDAGQDTATWSIVDMETYHMNLTEANVEGSSPEYRIRYTAQNSYSVTSMTPASVDQLVVDMATDDDLFSNFVWNTHNVWSEIPDTWTCDADCRKATLCDLVTADSSNHEPCKRIDDIIDGVNP